LGEIEQHAREDTIIAFIGNKTDLKAQVTVVSGNTPKSSKVINRFSHTDLLEENKDEFDLVEAKGLEICENNPHFIRMFTSVKNREGISEAIEVTVSKILESGILERYHDEDVVGLYPRRESRWDHLKKACC